jgi:hypothetical protein
MSVYPEADRHGDRSPPGEAVMQISRPRDLGPLILVVGMFLILLAVTLTVGAPQR